MFIEPRTASSRANAVAPNWRSGGWKRSAGIGRRFVEEKQQIG